MKTKRCTNPSCRREFKVEVLACPHCGKKYPRESISLEKNQRYSVILSYAGSSRSAIIEGIRKHTGLRQRDAALIARYAPSLIGTDFRASQAEALKAEIRAAGGDAMIVPTNRGTKGVFVLPKKAG